MITLEQFFSSCQRYIDLVETPPTDPLIRPDKILNEIIRKCDDQELAKRVEYMLNTLFYNWAKNNDLKIEPETDIESQEFYDFWPHFLGCYWSTAQNYLSKSDRETFEQLIRLLDDDIQTLEKAKETVRRVFTENFYGSMLKSIHDNELASDITSKQEAPKFNNRTEDDLARMIEALKKIRELHFNNLEKLKSRVKNNTRNTALNSAIIECSKNLKDSFGKYFYGSTATIVSLITGEEVDKEKVQRLLISKKSSLS